MPDASVRKTRWTTWRMTFEAASGDTHTASYRSRAAAERAALGRPGARIEASGPYTGWVVSYTGADGGERRETYPSRADAEARAAELRRQPC